jgi:hypothetical protein
MRKEGGKKGGKGGRRKEGRKEKEGKGRKETGRLYKSTLVFSSTSKTLPAS